MILIPPEQWENISYEAPPPLPSPPVKTILDSNDRSYNKWTQVRLHHDPILENRETKTRTHPHSYYRNR